MKYCTLFKCILIKDECQIWAWTISYHISFFNAFKIIIYSFIYPYNIKVTKISLSIKQQELSDWYKILYNYMIIILFFQAKINSQKKV